MNENLADLAARYQWYHNVEYAPGQKTHGHPWSDIYVNRISEVMRRIDFARRRVLDIGCRDGALSFLAEELGASEVIGVDNDLSIGLTDFLIPVRKSKVRAYLKNVHDLKRTDFGEFDFVIFPGVLYHLRYPAHALRRIADITREGGSVLIESGFIEGFADLPVLFCPIGTDSPYEPTSVTFFNHAGLCDTLLSIGFSDIKAHGPSFPDHTSEQERSYVSRRFPQFAETKQELRICRKIYTCTKGWTKDDPRLNSDLLNMSQEFILREYWDGDHALHTGRRVS